jgi:imidazolonepropionase-like amidohydrolase
MRLLRSAPFFATLLAALALGCAAPMGPVLVAWPEVRPEAVVLRDVRILDVRTGRLGGRSDVRLEGDRIAAIAKPGGVELAGAVVVEGGGASLLPGLVDMHGHIATPTGPAWEFTSPPTPELNLRAYVYAGVTTVFDPGDGSGDAFDRRKRVGSGALIGPQIFTVGPILTAPSSHPIAMIEELLPGWLAWIVARGVAIPLEDDAAARAVVEELAEEGADGIKIVVDRIPLESRRLSLERARAVVEAGRAQGLRTVAHIGTTEDALDAGRAGVALWVHGVYKERIPDERIAELAAYGIPMVTTSEVFDSYGRIRFGPLERTRLERETVPKEKLDSFHPIPEAFDAGPLEGWIVLMQETREVRLDNVRRLHDAGVTILTGSDVQSNVFPGASLHRELHTLVQAGLTPAEALRAATLHPAQWISQEDDPPFGVIGVGKRADLILVEGDPTSDVGVLEEIRAVILAGVPVDRVPVGK